MVTMVGEVQKRLASSWFFNDWKYEIYYLPKYKNYTMQVETAIFALSLKKPSSSLPSEFDPSSCQFDMVYFALLSVFMRMTKQARVLACNDFLIISIQLWHILSFLMCI